ncbi:hypothetical protein [Embleya sp. NPDC020630]|uniref:hypothetical protein n=1 Tax=Embleya sp. NPDC020630 TaxID=3363979 RepID=UPI00379A7313
MSSTTLSRPARSRTPHRTAAALVSLVVAAGLVAAAAPAAHAAASTTCTGTATVGYSPGLTLTPQTVTLNESDSVPSCVSTDPTITGVVTGPYSYPLANASCNNVQVDPGSVLVIHWNNGRSSTVGGLTYVTTTTLGISQTIGTGTVSAGEFTGAAGILTWLFPLVNPLSCLTPGGLTGQSGTIVAEVVG